MATNWYVVERALDALADSLNLQLASRLGSSKPVTKAYHTDGTPYLVVKPNAYQTAAIIAAIAPDSSYTDGFGRTQSAYSSDIQSCQFWVGFDTGTTAKSTVTINNYATATGAVRGRGSVTFNADFTANQNVKAGTYTYTAVASPVAASRQFQAAAGGAAATATSFVAAINADQYGTFTATVDGVNPAKVNLVARIPGAGGNQTLTTTGNATLVNSTGGVNGSYIRWSGGTQGTAYALANAEPDVVGDTASETWFRPGSSNAECAQNLFNSINAAPLGTGLSNVFRAVVVDSTHLQLVGGAAGAAYAGVSVSSSGGWASVSSLNASAIAMIDPVTAAIILAAVAQFGSRVNICEKSSITYANLTETYKTGVFVKPLSS